jgi:hypothetical protein
MAGITMLRIRQHTIPMRFIEFSTAKGRTLSPSVSLVFVKEAEDAVERDYTQAIRSATLEILLPLIHFSDTCSL